MLILSSFSKRKHYTKMRCIISYLGQQVCTLWAHTHKRGGGILENSVLFLNALVYLCNEIINIARFINPLKEFVNNWSNNNSFYNILTLFFYIYLSTLVSGMHTFILQRTDKKWGKFSKTSFQVSSCTRNVLKVDIKKS